MNFVANFIDSLSSYTTVLKFYLIKTNPDAQSKMENEFKSSQRNFDAERLRLLAEVTNDTICITNMFELDDSTKRIDMKIRTDYCIDKNDIFCIQDLNDNVILISFISNKLN